MNTQARDLLETIKARQDKINEEKKNIDEEIKQVEKMVEKETISYEDIAKILFGNSTVFYFGSSGLYWIAEMDIDHPEITRSTNAPTKQQLESILALNKLCNVAKYLNDGWLPDWKNYDDQKWLIKMFDDKIYVVQTRYDIYSTIYFCTQELGHQAIEILGEEEIKKALQLNH